MNEVIKQNIKKTKIRYRKIIEEAEKESERLRETHIENHDRQFSFKLDGDEPLITKTLKNALNSLKTTNKNLDDKLKYIDSKNNAKDIMMLKMEIDQLEIKLKST